MEIRSSGNQDEGGRDLGSQKVRKQFQRSSGQDKIHLFVQVVHELFTSGQNDARSKLASEAARGTSVVRLLKHPCVAFSRLHISSFDKWGGSG